MSDDREALDAKQATKNVILIVEDDEDIGHVIVETLLQETAYIPLFVTTGHGALHAVQTIVPALFLLDYQLPSITGIQLFDQFQHVPALATVPTIMMSANLPDAELDKRRILGLKKPFDLDDLLAIIEQALQ